MAADLRSLVGNPRFLALSADRQRVLAGEVEPAFGKLDAAAQDRILTGLAPDPHAFTDRRHGFPEGTMKALEQVESGGGKNLVSSTGVRGPFQITHETAAEYGLPPELHMDRMAQMAAAGNILADRTRKYGGLEGGLTHYGDPKDTGYAARVMKRIGPAAASAGGPLTPSTLPESTGLLAPRSVAMGLRTGRLVTDPENPRQVITPGQKAGETPDPNEGWKDWIAREGLPAYSLWRAGARPFEQAGAAVTRRVEPVAERYLGPRLGKFVGGLPGGAVESIPMMAATAALPEVGAGRLGALGGSMLGRLALRTAPTAMGMAGYEATQEPGRAGEENRPMDVPGAMERGAVGGAAGHLMFSEAPRAVSGLFRGRGVAPKVEPATTKPGAGEGAPAADPEAPFVMGEGTPAQEPPLLQSLAAAQPKPTQAPSPPAPRMSAEAGDAAAAQQRLAATTALARTQVPAAAAAEAPPPAPVAPPEAVPPAVTGGPVLPEGAALPPPVPAEPAVPVAVRPAPGPEGGQVVEPAPVPGLDVPEPPGGLQAEEVAPSPVPPSPAPPTPVPAPTGPVPAGPPDPIQQLRQRVAAPVPTRDAVAALDRARVPALQQALAEAERVAREGTNPKGRPLPAGMVQDAARDAARIRERLKAVGAEPPVPAAGPASTSIPSELEAVFQGKARAFLRPPPEEGTVPTAGEQALTGTDLRKLARDRRASYFKGKDGSEVVFDPQQVSRRELSGLDKTGRLAEVVNGPGTSPKPAEPKEAVVVRTPEGQEARTVLTATPEATEAAVRAQPEGFSTEVAPAETAVPKVLSERGGVEGIPPDLAAEPPGSREAVRAAMGRLGPEEAVAAAQRLQTLVDRINDPEKAPKTPVALEKLVAQARDLSRSVGLREDVPGAEEALRRARGRQGQMAAQRYDVFGGERYADPELERLRLVLARAKAEAPKKVYNVRQQQKSEQRIANAWGELESALGAYREHVGGEPERLPAREVPAPRPRGEKGTTLGMGLGALGDFSQLKKTWTRFRRKLPTERDVLRERPNSPVIAEVERWNANLADRVQDRVNQPWHQGVTTADPEVLKTSEEEAVRYWQAHDKTPEAAAAARQAFPPEVQRAMEQRDVLFDQANDARDFFGLEPVRRMEGPYLPRKVEEGRHAVALTERGRAGGGLKTSPGGHAAERVFDTYREGERAGMEYADPRNQILQRDYNDLSIIATRDLFQHLEDKGVLFRDREGAAKASPSGQPWAVENAPGGEWWTPTEAEARFLRQNLSRSPEGPFTSLVGYLNQAFRNPNLVNPAPHVIKNMGAKLLLARGPIAPFTLARDSVEFFRKSNPELLREFNEAMPFSESGKTAGELVGREMRRGPAGEAVRAVTRLGSMANRPSQKFIFRWADPAMRYSLFKYYRQQGLPTYEAGNHAWIDLIRYGTRSHLTDFWKSMPANFFVPWRFGTFTSLVKQATYHPARTALLLGAVDYLREVNRRQRGKWIHLPWDYVEAPLAQLVQSKDGVDLLKNASSQAALTALFGPGGAFGASQLDSLLKTVQMQGSGQDTARLKNMFWGISQFYNLPEQYRKGDYAGMLMTALTGEHDALKYPPRQLWAQYLPQSLPGMEKSPAVHAAELEQQEQTARGEQREALKPARDARNAVLQQIEQAYVDSRGAKAPEQFRKQLSDILQRAKEQGTVVSGTDIGKRLLHARIRATEAEYEGSPDRAEQARLEGSLRALHALRLMGSYRRVPQSIRATAMATQPDTERQRLESLIQQIREAIPAMRAEER